MPYHHDDGTPTWAYVARDGDQVYVVTTDGADAKSTGPTFRPHTVAKGGDGRT